MVSELEPAKDVSKDPSRSWIRTTCGDDIEVTETAEEVARMVQESTETREKPNTIDTDNFATTDMETFRQGMAAIASTYKPNNP